MEQSGPPPPANSECLCEKLRQRTRFLGSQGAGGEDLGHRGLPGVPEAPGRCGRGSPAPAHRTLTVQAATGGRRAGGLGSLHRLAPRVCPRGWAPGE